MAVTKYKLFSPYGVVRCQYTGHIASSRSSNDSSTEDVIGSERVVISFCESLAISPDFNFSIAILSAKSRVLLRELTIDLPTILLNLFRISDLNR